jgi:hypothetical protein
MRVLVVAVLLFACGGGQSPNGGAACGPVTCGAGSVCCDRCIGQCVPEESGAQCPDDTDPGRTCSQACGTMTCNPDVEVCVGVGPIGPSIDHACEPIPTGCANDRSCDCVGESLCPAQTVACSDVAINEIFCDNGTQ